MKAVTLHEQPNHVLRTGDDYYKHTHNRVSFISSSEYSIFFGNLKFVFSANIRLIRHQRMEKGAFPFRRNDTFLRDTGRYNSGTVCQCWRSQEEKELGYKSLPLVTVRDDDVW